LSDEVYDEGDSLLFRKGENEQRVHLRQIKKIRPYNNAWIKLKTTSEGKIGNNLYFLLPPRLFAFTKHPYSIELEKRVNSANNT
jgi:hypothetical protein